MYSSSSYNPSKHKESFKRSQASNQHINHYRKSEVAPITELSSSTNSAGSGGSDLDYRRRRQKSFKVLKKMHKQTTRNTDLLDKVHAQLGEISIEGPNDALEAKVAFRRASSVYKQ